LINEEAKMEIIGTKKGELDDANADPSSPVDRLGYFERHYRKAEYQIPMRDACVSSPWFIAPLINLNVIQFFSFVRHTEILLTVRNLPT
jgi:hypothetical protein